MFSLDSCQSHMNNIIYILYIWSILLNKYCVQQCFLSDLRKQMSFISQSQSPKCGQHIVYQNPHTIQSPECGQHIVYQSPHTIQSPKSAQVTEQEPHEGDSFTVSIIYSSAGRAEHDSYCAANATICAPSKFLLHFDSLGKCVQCCGSSRLAVTIAASL